MNECNRSIDQSINQSINYYALPMPSVSISISISFSIAQTPTVRPRAHYIVIISCVIRSSVHGWEGTFSVLGER